mgnify:CR=1 FL=1
MTITNPLIATKAQDFPAFDSIQPSHVVPAIDELLQQAETALEKVTANDFPSEWNAISLELDVSGERLNRAWGAVSHLNSVADNPELRAAYNEALPKIFHLFTRWFKFKFPLWRYKSEGPFLAVPKPVLADKVPLVPKLLFRLSLILIIPAFPAASYLDEGLVMSSIVAT